MLLVKIILIQIIFKKKLNPYFVLPRHNPPTFFPIINCLPRVHQQKQNYVPHSSFFHCLFSIALHLEVWRDTIISTTHIFFSFIFSPNFNSVVTVVSPPNILSLRLRLPRLIYTGHCKLLSFVIVDLSFLSLHSSNFLLLIFVP